MKLPTGQKYFILKMLSDGKKHNGIDIVKKLKYSSPKARILELDKQGWKIKWKHGKIYRRNGGTIIKRKYFDCKMSKEHCDLFRKLSGEKQEKHFWKNLFKLK